MSFHATPNTANAITYAYDTANYGTPSGITRDGSIVTSKESIDYQIKENNLIMEFEKVMNNTIKITYHGWK